MLLGLWCFYMLAAGGWYPKTLPCDINLASNGSGVNVDCTERGLMEVQNDISKNITNITVTNPAEDGASSCSGGARRSSSPAY